MLIFNGKKYFVPFIGAAADATPEQVVEGVKFVGAKGVVEEGALPYYNYEIMDAGVYESDDEYAYIQSSVDKESIIEDVVYSKVHLSEFGESGASIETCNVTINIVDNVGYLGVTATQFANGAVTTFIENKSSGTFTIPNVVCGSIITIVCNSWFSIDGWSVSSQVGSTSLALIAPSTTGDYSANIIEYED